MIIKIQKKVKKYITLLVLILGMIACTNDTGNVSPLTANTPAAKHDGSRKDVTSATTVYRVKDDILNQFIFYCQLSATSLSTRTQACAPDAYMIGANSIALFKEIRSDFISFNWVFGKNSAIASFTIALSSSGVVTMIVDILRTF